MHLPNHIQYREANTGDLGRIMDIIVQAKERMRAAGSTQWQGVYPALESIESDIALGYGVVAYQPHAPQIIAYAAVIFDAEPAYEQITGRWLSDQPYVVVHRLAVANEALHQGVATAFMRHISHIASTKGLRSFRIDTSFDNLHMQRILATLGFTLCGEIRYESGLRQAYEKQITNG